MWFNIDLIIVILFLIVNFLVGFGISRKRSINDFKTYSLGNFKNPSLVFLTASSACYFISGGVFIALLQQSYNTGLPYILKNSIFQPLSYVIVASFVFPLHKNLKKESLTLNEWMDEKFHSSFLRALIGVSEFLLVFGVLVIQFKAFSTIAKTFFDLPPQYEKMCTIGFAIFLGIYTFKRGFVAIALTDILQFCVFAVAFVCLLVFVAFKSHFFVGVWDKGVIENPKMTVSSCFKDYNTTIFTLGIWIQTLLPQLNGARYQRIMMCNDVKKVRKGVIFSTVIITFFIISSICISLLIFSQNPNLKITEIVPFFVNNYCPTGLKGLLGAGLFAMSISTIESFLNSNSVVFTNDIIPFFYKMFSKKTYIPSVFTARIVTISLCFLSVYISFKFTDIFSILIAFSNFYYPIAIIPAIVLGLGFNFNKISIMSGVFCGIITTLINYYLTKNPSSYFLGLVAHLVGLLLVEFVLRMKKKKTEIPL